jgi:hypothetical protein
MKRLAMLLMAGRRVPNAAAMVYLGTPATKSAVMAETASGEYSPVRSTVGA